MKLVRYLLFVPLLLAGCGVPTQSVVADRKATEQSMKEAIDAKFKASNVPTRCLNVSLIEETPSGQYPQIYTGWADVSSKERVFLKVTVAQDQAMQWETTKPPVKIP